MKTVEYVLGHSPKQLARLEAQSEMVRPITERLLREICIKPGMRVLEIGSGYAIFRFSSPIGSGQLGGLWVLTKAAAEKRVRLMRLKNVSFQHASAETFSAPETFDVAIARFVLMHQANPIEVLSAAARSVKSGGVVAIVNQIRHAQHFVLALAFRYLIRQSTA
jgi:ubiquinone/menaquinone biosynthesis C-methylase UbiE